MTNGWNVEYINSKIEKFKELVLKEEDLTKKDEYQKLLDTYNFLLLTLAFQGDTIYFEEDVSTEEFLQDMNGIRNNYNYGKKVNGIVSKIANEVLSLDFIPDNLTYDDNISYDEITDLIYEFLREQFGQIDSSIFKNYFIDNKNYILLNKLSDISSVAVCDNELFISLTNEQSITLCVQMAHEAGHVRKLVVNNTVNNNCLLGEFESFTYEIRLLLWMIQNNIHKKDAIKYLLNYLNLLENCLVIRHYNNKYNLTHIKNPEKFESRCEQLKLFDRSGINDYRDLFDFFNSMIDKNYLMYLISYISVINELGNQKFNENYGNIIRNVGHINDFHIFKLNNLKSFGDLKTYKVLRKELISKL